MPLKALFLVSKMYLIRVLSFIGDVRFNVRGEHVPGCSMSGDEHVPGCLGRG